MLVRLKKRGEWPHGLVAKAAEAFRGCCIEVSQNPEDADCDELTRGSFAGCDAEIYVVTDRRYLALSPHTDTHATCICSHFLIDDLNAYDSDSCDEHAAVGDLAFADVSVPTKVAQ